MSTATRPEHDLRCPRCGTPLADDQSWCLECGYGARTRLLRPAPLRVPALIAALVLALLGAGIALAVVELSSGPGSQGLVPSTPNTTATAPAQTTVASWPPGVTGWTPVILVTKSRAQAEARARALLGKVAGIGVLDSDGYEGLTPHRYVVFAGTYATQTQATAAAGSAVKAGVKSPQVTQIIPR